MDEDREAMAGGTPPGSANDAPKTSMPVPKAKAAVAHNTEELPAVPAGRDSLEFDDFDDSWPDDDDLERSRRFDAAGRAKARRVTSILALVAALGVGFAGGVLYQKHQGSSTDATAGGASSFAALRSAFAGAGGGGAATGGGAAGGTGTATGAGGASGFAGLAGRFGGGNSVVGTVSAVANGTLYISQGTTSALVKVVTGPASTVKVSASGTVGDVQPGDTVIITGAKQKDGSYMAASITDSGAAASSDEPGPRGPVIVL